MPDRYVYQVIQCYRYVGGSSSAWFLKPFDTPEEAQKVLDQAPFPGYVQQLLRDERREDLRGWTAGVTYQKFGEQYDYDYWRARLLALGLMKPGEAFVSFPTYRWVRILMPDGNHEDRLLQDPTYR